MFGRNQWAKQDILTPIQIIQEKNYINYCEVYNITKQGIRKKQYILFKSKESGRNNIFYLQTV